jgi:transcriptional regulator with XRE-family HTH domain
MQQASVDATAAITFGNLVRQLRRERGWTQEELASRSGLNVTTVSNVERGATRRLFTDTLDRFATAFEVPAEVLDPRRLADAVAEGALSLRRREAIEAVLRLPEEEVSAILDVLQKRTERERARTKKRR